MLAYKIAITKLINIKNEKPLDEKLLLNFYVKARIINSKVL